MDFEKPDLDSLESERDVEHKFLFPLMIGAVPSGLGYDPTWVKTQKNIRKFSIGKGSDQKSYFPDYLVVRGTVPLAVAEGKKPGSDLMEAFREARLYAAELNAIYPNGLNPVSRIIASDGTRVLAGWHDQANPLLDVPFDAIATFSPKMDELVTQFGGAALEKYYLSLLPNLKPTRY